MTRIKNWTDDAGVIWGQKQNKKGEPIGNPFKVNDPNYKPEPFTMNASDRMMHRSLGVVGVLASIGIVVAIVAMVVGA
jgi:hypothetical protein